MGYFLVVYQWGFRRCRLVTHFLPILLCMIFLSTGAFAEKYALLVGINQYPHVRSLKGSVNDITQVKRVLVQDLGFADGNIRVLTDAQATKANIVAALDSLAKQTKAGDSLLWYYSGHGFSMQDVDGDEAVRDPDDHYDEILVPYDAVPFPRERATDPNTTMLGDDEIARALSGMAGRRMVVVFDSCHSGSALRGLGDTDSRSLYPGFVPPEMPKTRSLVHTKQPLDLTGPVIFVSAAGSLQSASDVGEFEGERHGAFTAGLLRSIRKAGPDWQYTLSWEELFRRTKDDMLSQGFTGQTPTIQAPGGLTKRSIAEFFDPSPSSEIADLDSPQAAFGIEMESHKYRFLEGDLLTLAVQSERNGYLYIFDIDAEKNITQLFPNKFAPQNRVQAGRLKMIPGEQDAYQLRAGPPFGKSVVVAVVTTEPWLAASELKMPDDFRPITEDQMGELRRQLRFLHEAAKSSSGVIPWAIQKMVLEIAPADHVPLPAERPEPKEDATEKQKAQAEAIPEPGTTPPQAEVHQEGLPSTSSPPTEEKVAAIEAKLDPAATAPPASLEGSAFKELDDSGLSWEDQRDLPARKPELFKKLQTLAERYSPVFWQDVSGDFDKNFQPWKDFIVRYDFDLTEEGPNWPEPPRFQDDRKRERNDFLNSTFSPSSAYEIVADTEIGGMYRARNKQTGETVRLDLRPFVYWTVLTTPSHFFFHYVVFHAQDWKGLLGHTGDLEGTTVVVDRKTERITAAFTLAHDDVDVVRSLDEDPEPNIGVLVSPEWETRGLLDEDDERPIDGLLGMDVSRDGETSPKEHQEIYVETKGHGQYGSKKINKSRYVIYGNFFDEATFTSPSFQRDQYPQTDRFSEVLSKHKYELVYIGSGESSEPTLWSQYRSLNRFPGGVNAPWNWRDNLFFKTGWWKDPRRIKKIGDEPYRINPYLEPAKANR